MLIEYSKEKLQYKSGQLVTAHTNPSRLNFYFLFWAHECVTKKQQKSKNFSLLLFQTDKGSPLKAGALIEPLVLL